MMTRVALCRTKAASGSFALVSGDMRGLRQSLIVSSNMSEHGHVSWRLLSPAFNERITTNERIHNSAPFFLLKFSCLRGENIVQSFVFVLMFYLLIVPVTARLHQCKFLAFFFETGLCLMSIKATCSGLWVEKKKHYNTTNTGCAFGFIL